MSCDVLVVEDDEDIRDSLLEILRDEGLAACGSPHGAAALEHLRSAGPVSLILLDRLMPVMDGPTFCAELAEDEALARIPIVLLTAESDAAQQAAKLGLAAGLSKPVALGTLLSLVRRLLGASRR
jgi:CheY-like chemotaxis protein